MGEPRSRGMLFVGIDVGTQSTKALVVDAARREIVARAQHAHELIAGLPPGHMEQHPQQWLDAVMAVVRSVARHVDVARIAGIGVSGQQHGCVVLDARGDVVRPAKLWCDTSTAAEARALGEQLGRTVPTGFTASKLVWLRANEPANWERVQRVLLPHDFVNSWLCGEASMEHGDASGTGFFDPVARCFDDRAMAAIDPRLPSLLPPLHAPGELAGRLCAPAARALGLPAGIPVAAGGGDNMMSAIGSGATKEGVVVASLGTSATIFARTARPMIDPHGLIAPFCSSDGAWLPLLCTMNATGVLEEVRALTGLDHRALTSAAERVAAGSDGLLLLPFLLGERVPDLPLATGTLLGLRPGLLRAGHLYRAAIEGVSLNLAAGLDRMRALGLVVDQVRVTGGAAGNALWRQVLADLFAVPVRPLREVESAALGGALQAEWIVRRLAGERELTTESVAADYVELGEATEPQPAASAAHAALRERFQEALARVHPG